MPDVKLDTSTGYLKEYAPRASSLDGRRSKCTFCERTRSREYQRAKRERSNKTQPPLTD